MNQLVRMETAQQFSMAEIERVALAIAKGGLFGTNDQNAVLTLCLLAQAEGRHPAVVFRDYHVIQGRPAKKADAMLRDFIEAGGHIKWHQLDDTCADATFSHPSGEARIEWTMARAQKAQLKTPMWSKYPRQMLRSRTISEGIRTVYPGATSGLYEENEVRDIVADQPQREAIEHRSEPEQSAEHRPEYNFPDGPATGISQLKNMVRGLWREVAGCGDDSELLTLLETQEAVNIMAQCDGLENPAHREIWEGDGKDNPGLSGLIAQRKDEFKTRDMNIISGGKFQPEEV